MWPGLHAETNPDKAAYIMAATGEVVTYQQLDDRSNQTARLFADLGLRFGDNVAILIDNRREYLEVAWAAQRSGLRYTAINWHFTPEEAAYVIDDCGARVLVVSERFADLGRDLCALTPKVEHRFAVGEPIEGHAAYDEARDRFPAEPLPEELEGTPMLYSSGTTGRPKGIKLRLDREPVGNAPGQLMLLTSMFGMDDASVYLSPAPLYHAAPLFYSLSVTRLGGTVVIMDHFDAEDALRAIERYGVTHSQWVPTMFIRMLRLPDETRSRYDLSSHRCAIHAAAPCPVDVKRAMIEWWGPIVWEYYSATEGMGATFIDSDQWIAHPGSVGRSLLGPIHICDDDGNDLATGEVGTVWFEPLASRPGFEYHNDPEKTRSSYNLRGWASVGDMGYLDADGFLYLTDRQSFMIVSGGVNIYPQEVENLLATHPKVADAAVFGVPNDEMGEEVKAVIQPLDPAAVAPDLERELIAFCREHLAHYKCPRSVDFEAELPRQPTGKLYKRVLRDRYWAGHDSRIV